MLLLIVLRQYLVLPSAFLTDITFLVQQYLDNKIITLNFEINEYIHQFFNNNTCLLLCYYYIYIPMHQKAYCNIWNHQSIDDI